jgi:DNA-binding winged helix-turn-helix (wHTH) protein
VDLTRREFELIQLLASAQGLVLPREEIYQRVWGYAMVHGDRSVDVFVRKLRQKLERVSPEWRYIHTHFGVGYRFAAEPVPGTAAAEAAGLEREFEQMLASEALDAGEEVPAEEAGAAEPARVS